MFKLRVHKLVMVPHYVLVDENGTVFDEVTAQQISLYPGKFMEMAKLVEELERDANEKDLSLLVKKPLW